METLEKLLAVILGFIDDDGLKVYCIINESNYVHLTICKEENLSVDTSSDFESLMVFLNKLDTDIKLELINCFIEGSEELFYLKKLVSLRLIGDNIPNLQPLSRRQYLEELEILTSSNINLDEIHSLTSIKRIRYNNRVFSSPAELARFRQIR